MAFRKTLLGGALALIMAFAGPASAQLVILDGTDLGTAVNGQVLVPDGGTLTVLPGGSITNAGSVVLDVGGGTITVINGGALTSTFNGDGIGATGATLNLFNSGNISGVSNGVITDNLAILINSGIISASNGDAIDIDFGTIINHGTIIGGTNAGFDAIEIDRGSPGDASITNSGSILAGAGPTGSAIDFQGTGNDTLSLLPGSIIVGTISFGLGIDTLNVSPGLSIAKTFTGSLPEIINTNGSPFAVSGLQVAVVDPTLEALQDEILHDVTNSILGGVTARLDGLASREVVGVTRTEDRGGKTTFKSTHVTDTGDRQAWAHVLGGHRDQDSDGPTVESDYIFGGLVSGLDGRISSQARAGFFLGGLTGQAETDIGTQEEDIDMVFGGLYSRITRGRMAFDTTVLVGHSDHERRRQVANNTVVGGLETAVTDFEGTFVAVETNISTTVDVGERRILPSVTLRYAGNFLDGFTETGTAAPLIAGDRDVQLLVGKAQIALAKTSQRSDGALFHREFKIGVQGRTNIGDDAFAATLLGQGILFDPADQNDAGSIFWGSNLAYTLPNGRTQLYAASESGLENDGSFFFSGRGGVKVRF